MAAPTLRSIHISEKFIYTSNKCKAVYYNIEIDSGKNPKHFWSFTKAQMNQHLLPPVLQHETSGAEAADLASKAAMLIDYFQTCQTVYTHTPDEWDSVLPPVPPFNLTAMPAIYADSNEVCCGLMDTNTSEDCGSDNLSGFGPKKCADDLNNPMLYLFC